MCAIMIPAVPSPSCINYKGEVYESIIDITINDVGELERLLLWFEENYVYYILKGYEKTSLPQKRWYVDGDSRRISFRVDQTRERRIASLKVRLKWVLCKISISVPNTINRNLTLLRWGDTSCT